MIIAVLGFGNVGSQMAKLRKKAGHDVVIGLRDSSNDTAAAQQIAAVKLWIALAMKDVYKRQAVGCRPLASQLWGQPLTRPDSRSTAASLPAAPEGTRSCCRHERLDHALRGLPEAPHGR